MDGLINFTGSLDGHIEEGGGSGVTPHVTATASVNDQSGVPGVTVVRTGSDAAPNFDFNFVNLKGADGAPGAQGPQGLTGATGPAGAQGPRGFTGATGATGPAGADGYSPEVSITDIIGGHRITITDENHPLGQNFDIMNGVDGVDGADGSPGPEGPQGPAGVGVPAGGTAGQYLRKVGSGDYLTEWTTPAAAEISLDITNCQIVTQTNMQGAVEELDAELVSVNSSLTNYSRATAVTSLATANGTFTATEAGYLWVYCVKNDDNNSSEYILQISGISVLRYRVTGDVKVYNSFLIPMSKGDTITCNTVTNMYQLATNNVKFIPRM